MRGRLALTVAVLLPIAPAAAYVRDHSQDGKAVLRWKTNVVTLALARTAPPRDFSETEARQAVAAALAVWDQQSNPCSRLRLELAPGTTGNEVVRDGVSSVSFRESHWSRNGREGPMAKYPANRIAITTFYTEPRRARGRAKIVEADIEINAVDFRFVGGRGGHEARGSMSVNLTAVLAHEIGHILGLGHNCAATSKEEGKKDHRGRKIPRCCDASTAERQSIMFPIESLALRPIAGRLSRDDRDGLCALYPSRASSVMSTKKEKP